MTVYHANFAMPAGAAAPDHIDDAEGAHKPADDVVVSRYADGRPASRFGDLVWDMSPYHPDGRATYFYFGYWGEGEPTPTNARLSREMREIVGLLMWKRVGNPYSLSSLRNFVRLMWPLAEFAEEQACSIARLLNDLPLLLEFVARQPLRLTHLSSAIGALAKIGPQSSGFDVIGQSARAILSESVAPGDRKQHPPIPTRVYSHVLTQLAVELEDWRAVAEPFLAFTSACTQDRNLGRADSRNRRAAARKLNPHLPSLPLPHITTLLQERGLADYFAQKGLTLEVTGLVMGLLRVQMAAKLTIQAFTGMRDDEATSLPLDCLEVEKSGGALHYLVTGRTTKFNDGRAKATRWVTNQEGCRAIQTAQTIARMVYQATGRDTESTEEPLFLFVSPGHLGMTYGPRSPTSVLVPGQLKLVSMPDLRVRLTPLIQDEDLLELEQIDPHRAWRAESKFQVGQPWPLTSHQYRRSLALYAQRSGLVSLPSLRRQLQHLTEEMTRYYQKGSIYARNFIGDDTDHFGLEWQQAQAESSALGYILNVLLSNDVMFGGHANWVDHRLRSPEGIVVVDRAQTMRRFKKGELAYRETAIGGCTNVKSCDKPTLRFLDMECLRHGCANMVGNLPKLERVIAGQEARLASIDPDSMEYRVEQEELNILIATRDRVTVQLEG